MSMRVRIAFATLALSAVAASAHASSLLVNGDFELTNNGYSQVATPLGWHSVGHVDGVIAYSLFGTPAYDGSYFYDLGGFGQVFPTPGDGIEQTVATNIGTSYTLQFGLSGENVSGAAILNVLINGTLQQSFAVPQSFGLGAFRNPFVTQSLTYTADSLASTIRFTVTGGPLGNNDPLIDAVSFDVSPAQGPQPVPEPATWLAVLTGLLASKRRFFRRPE